jgi:hypothetical protein
MIYPPELLPRAEEEAEVIVCANHPTCVLKERQMTAVADLEQRNEALALWRKWMEAEAVAAEGGKEADIEAVAAMRAYNDHPTPALLTNFDGDGVRLCGKSGTAIFEDDEVLEDTHTGEMFLRSALGLPPREADKVEEAA